MQEDEFISQLIYKWRYSIWTPFTLNFVTSGWSVLWLTNLTHLWLFKILFSRLLFSIQTIFLVQYINIWINRNAINNTRLSQKLKSKMNASLLSHWLFSGGFHTFSQHNNALTVTSYLRRLPKPRAGSAPTVEAVPWSSTPPCLQAFPPKLPRQRGTVPRIYREKKRGSKTRIKNYSFFRGD